MTEFPSIVPTSRNVTLGTYPVKRFNSIAGTGITRIYGSQPFGSGLEMNFENIPDSSASLISDCYNNARGGYDQIGIPETLWKGMEKKSGLSLKLERDYIWRFAEPPRITSVRPGRSSVTVRLEGMRDG